MAERQNVYRRIIEHIFFSYYAAGVHEVVFDREDIQRAAEQLGVRTPSNVGDVVYSFRFRAMLPESIRAKAPEGRNWIIRSAGPSRYSFVAILPVTIVPNEMVAETKIPDSTPGVIAKYALGDEQALLAKLRYNRLIDVFTGVTCYSLQSHLRTHVTGIGQVETDEIYIGVDRRGAHYIFPVQAKGGRDIIGIVQIEQDFALCAARFSSLICRPIAAQFMADDLIALFEFEESDSGVRISSEKHYRLVPPEQVTNADLENYRLRVL